MRILLVSQYFAPETFIINDLVLEIKELGHEVTVLTGKPNYPDGNVFEGYTEKGYFKDSFGGIDVHRVPLRARRKGGAKNLILNYLSFVLSGCLWGPRLFRKKKFDVIFVFALSPITSVLPAILLKWIQGGRLAIWVQDLWPESLAATGYIKRAWALKVVGYLVKFIYWNCDLILVQSEAFKDRVARFTSLQKILYYPNSFLNNREKLSSEQYLPKSVVMCLENNFCVVFAGNIGKAQSVETIVEAATFTRDLKDFKVVVVGSGSMLSYMVEQKERQGLENLEFVGRLPMEAMPAIFKRAGALLVTLAGDEIFGLTIPSKIQAYLAAGRPIIGSLSGEGAKVIEDAKAGVVGPSQDGKKLGENMRFMYSLDDSQREKISLNARTYFKENFEMKTQAGRLVKIFEELKNGRKEWL